MNKKITRILFAILFAMLLSGCGGETAKENENSVIKNGTIPFHEGQLYAVAYLGYQDDSSLKNYTDKYLEDSEVSEYYISGGDYYLIIPRYSEMTLELYKADMETMENTLVLQEDDCGAFIIQCNVSDIFPDALIKLSHGDDTTEFSPFISLKDGALDVGERGLDITEGE